MQKRTFATDLRHSSDQQFLTNDLQILAHDMAHELAHEPFFGAYMSQTPACILLCTSWFEYLSEYCFCFLSYLRLKYAEKCIRDEFISLW